MMIKNLYFLIAFAFFCIQIPSKAELVNIPDANFRAKLKSLYPTCFVGEQMETTCIGITSARFLEISSLNISNLSGIEYFTGLDSLNCMSNQLTSLPALPNKLTLLWCGYNKFTTPPTVPAGLKYYNCYNNQLTSLLSLPSGLLELGCGGNLLTTLPTLPSSLKVLSCSSSPLTSLPNLPGSLEQLDCDLTKISVLPTLPASLLHLYCQDNELVSLPTLPGGLINLYCYNNKLTSLPTLPSSLNYLYCVNNQLTSLPVLPAGLSNFYCTFNLLDFEDLEAINPIPQDYDVRFQNYSILPATQILSAGNDLVINGTIGGSANHYQWYKDNVLIPGANMATYSKANIKVSDGGIYRCRVTSSANTTTVSGVIITSSSIEVTVLKGNQNITFKSLPNKGMGDAPFALLATASSGLPVSYVSSNTSVATISGDTVKIVGIGTTVIAASQGGNIDYNPAPNVEQNFTVKTNQTITFTSLSSRTYGNSPFALSATSSSGLSVSYVSSNTSVATITGNTVTIVGAGTANITASQAGNINYNAASDVVQSLTVNKKSQSITFTTLSNKILGDSPFTLTASASSILPVSYTSSNPSVATVSGNAVTIKGPGITNITAIQAGNDNYNAAPDVIQTLTIGKAYQSIPFDKIPVKNFGDMPFTLRDTTTAKLTISYTSSNTSVATVSGNVVTIVGAGTTNITASQAGNENYNAAIEVVQSLVVNKALQNITFSTISSKTFGDSPIALSAASSSGLTVSYESSNTSVATISANTVTIVGAGTTIITTSQSGNANYNPAVNVARILTVGKANQTITFPALVDKTLEDAPFTLSATSSSGLAINYVSSNLSVAAVSGNKVTIIGPGTTIITASQAGNNNYDASSNISQSLTIHTVLGVEDSPASFDIVLSPNPTDGIFEFQLSQNTIAQINILNTSGSVIFQQKVVGNTEKIKYDISHLPSGLYIVQCHNDKHMVVKKIIKK